MQLLTEHNLAQYLRHTDRIPADAQVTVRELAGGVSNVVLYVQLQAPSQKDDGLAFVVKQAREQLRVQQPWFCRVERIWREVEVLRWCRRLLDDAAGRPTSKPQGVTVSQRITISTPTILWEDRDNYCFAMTAAPVDHFTWKAQLLRGEFDSSTAAACGILLGTLHARSWRSAAVADSLHDRSLFDDLRLDPYYRTVAKRYPEFAPRLQQLIDSVADNLLALAHADFSPKNLLAYPAGLMMVDFETGHFGDPAFDLGFFLSHLMLKSHYHSSQSQQAAAACWALAEPFWHAYRAQLAGIVPPPDEATLITRSIRHLAACGWARLDGKSPVDYLLEEGPRQRVRAACQRILRESPATWDEAAPLLGPAAVG